MDAFALSMSYGIKNISLKKVLITSLTVGIFHFFMPLIGNNIGNAIFEYTVIKPKIVLFLVFLIISIDMFIQFFQKEDNNKELNILGIIFFAISVSFDSLSVGFGISYLYDNIYLVVTLFCIISSLFTMLGFKIGKILSDKIGKYSFLIGSLILFVYSIKILTN
jgi:putative Mn2+ efflux pump MntP